MSLNIALQNALSGLRVSQGGMDIVSRNISNANTEGYTRKVAEQLNVVYRGQGAGAALAEVRRQVDEGLRRELENSTSLQSKLQVVDTVLSELELGFGKPNENTSIAGQLNTLRNSFEQLYANPENLTAQQAVLDKAQSLIDGLGAMSDQVQELRERTDADIATAVEETNAALAKIAELNDDIARLKAQGRSTADVEDLRDIEVRKVAENIGIKYFERSDGKLVLMTESSRYLVEYEDFQLSFDTTGGMDPNARYPGVLGGVTLNGVDITGEISSGKIGGLLELRDQRLVQAQGQLDEMAATMTEMFQATGVELFQDNGATFARGAGDVNVVGLSQRLTLNQDIIDEPWRLREGSDVVAVPTESANIGDTTIIEGIIDAFNATRAFTTTEPGGLTLGTGTGVTLQSYAAGIVSFQGVQRANTQAQLSFEQGLNLSLDQRLKNESGVNIDEEISTLIQLQTAYAASARVVSTITQAFDELLSINR
ncbi:flagellar hook-associated protein FlgK [Oceanibaculum pacificum]|nr:flagellar hook-associated protein FlgK [Oceanibaculum pacificum]